MKIGISQQFLHTTIKENSTPRQGRKQDNGTSNDFGTQLSALMVVVKGCLHGVITKRASHRSTMTSSDRPNEEKRKSTIDDDNNNTNNDHDEW
jgi:hypothetical protein